MAFIADINSDISGCKVSSFADDTRIMKEITNPEDCNELQRSLKRIYEWVELNNMVLNDGKFEALRYGKHPACSKLYEAPNGALINLKDSVRDLGVTITSDAKFDTHINATVQKCRKQMGWILRVFSTREERPMMTLYKSLVMPIAEYCCQLWSSLSVGLITAIEGLQRTYTSKIAGLQGLNYWERLRKLSLYSLQRRRERYIIIYTWKILNGLAPNFSNAHLKIETYGAGTRLGERCRLPPIVRSGDGTIRDQSFIVLGPKLFNCLPIELRIFHGKLEVFKRLLDSFLASIDDTPPQPGYVVAAGGNSILQQLAYSRAQTL